MKTLALMLLMSMLPASAEDIQLKPEKYFRIKPPAYSIPRTHKREEKRQKRIQDWYRLHYGQPEPKQQA